MVVTIISGSRLEEEEEQKYVRPIRSGCSVE
jgi:hypothetical protein